MNLQQVLEVCGDVVVPEAWYVLVIGNAGSIATAIGVIGTALLAVHTKFAAARDARLLKKTDDAQQTALEAAIKEVAALKEHIAL